MRYLRQQYGSICGPISVINAAKWAGLHLTKDDIPRLSERCEIANDQGTTIENLSKVLTEEISDVAAVQFMGPLNADTVLSLLKNSPNRAFILKYYHGEPAWHYVFCFRENSRTINVVNHYRGNPTVKKYSIRTFFAEYPPKDGEGIEGWLLARL